MFPLLRRSRIYQHDPRKEAFTRGFYAEAYLQLNPDVQAAGVDPEHHYITYGATEGRPYRHIAGVPSELDLHLHRNPKTKRPKFAKHATIWEWIRLNAQAPGFRVLELGSRSVVSDALWRKVIPNCNYVGFDVLSGRNVDVVGDIHKLSTYFEGQTFDFVMAFAVFEHLSMPWIAAEEISKVLAIGGHVVIETHFSYSEHELPWHFFQFNANALEVIFCPELGFELVDSGLDSPIVGRFSHAADPYLRGKIVPELYCHSSIIVKKVRHVDFTSFDWRSIIDRLASSSMYPLDSDMQRHGR
jgi:SAM-dependent methyltransferase